MLASFRDLIGAASKGRWAVGAFTCYNLETAEGVLKAASKTGTDVILLISPGSFKGAAGDRLASALLAAADISDVKVCVQLDHISDPERIEHAFKLGIGAVMADGSALPYEDNLEFTRNIVQMAAKFGAGVEAELGGIAGNEDVDEAVAAGKLTNPAQAVQFAGLGIDCLAVSIGNVHGTYRDEPRLDWDLLTDINGSVDLPLSLHGASGLPDDFIVRSVGLGIAKINVNTELRQQYLRVTAETVEATIQGAKLVDLHAEQVGAVEKVAESKLNLYLSRD